VVLSHAAFRRTEAVGPRVVVAGLLVVAGGVIVGAGAP
jgi:hypothetical protein